MKVGDLVIVKEQEAIIIDDCFRKTEQGCTMLVRLNNTSPAEELEVNREDVIEYGKDV